MFYAQIVIILMGLTIAFGCINYKVKMATTGKQNFLLFCGFVAGLAGAMITTTFIADARESIRKANGEKKLQLKIDSAVQAALKNNSTDR